MNIYDVMNMILFYYFTKKHFANDCNDNDFPAFFFTLGSICVHTRHPA